MKNNTTEISIITLHELAALASAVLDKIDNIHALPDSRDYLGDAEALAMLLRELLEQEAEKAMSQL